MTFTHGGGGVVQGTCPAQLIVCVVVDEAHRAVGNFAYVDIARRLDAKRVRYRMLALSATPGSDVAKIQEVKQTVVDFLLNSNHKSYNLI